MTEHFLGEIRAFSSDFIPNGWIPCNGQRLKISENNQLFKLIGSRFGGDGINFFNIPDLRGRTPIFPVDYVYGKKGGTETVKLSIENLPEHSHTVLVNTGIANRVKPDSNYLCITKPDPQFTDGFYAYTNILPEDSMNKNAMSCFGKSKAHKNIQPSLVINYCIAINGIYPQRN